VGASEGDTKPVTIEPAVPGCGHSSPDPSRHQRSVDGALRVLGGKPVTLPAPSRNSAGHQDLLTAVEAANPDGPSS
jgi:hypothetical protein